MDQHQRASAPARRSLTIHIDQKRYMTKVDTVSLVGDKDDID